jgi:hypothetical protein
MWLWITKKDHGLPDGSSSGITGPLVPSMPAWVILGHLLSSKAILDHTYGNAGSHWVIQSHIMSSRAILDHIGLSRPRVDHPGPM